MSVKRLHEEHFPHLTYNTVKSKVYDLLKKGKVKQKKRGRAAAEDVAGIFHEALSIQIPKLPTLLESPPSSIFLSSNI